MVMPTAFNQFDSGSIPLGAFIESEVTVDAPDALRQVWCFMDIHGSSVFMRRQAQTRQ
jgi:hypothetical protein